MKPDQMAFIWEHSELVVLLPSSCADEKFTADQKHISGACLKHLASQFILNYF